MGIRLLTSKAELDRLQAEQASAWIEVLRNGSLNDNARFVAWLKESPRNVRDILFMLTLEKTFDNLDAARIHETEALIAQMGQQVVAFPGRTSRGTDTAGRPRRLWWAAAASVAVLLACGVTYLLAQRTGWTDYRTAASEQRAFVLADGSVVQLNAQSHISVRLRPGERSVRLLEGEALFRVRHDASNPFLVQTDNARIEDVGTQFNVRSRPDGTFIAVLEGSVNVFSAAPPDARGVSHGLPVSGSSVDSGDTRVRSLKPNQEAHVSPVGAISVRTVSNIADAVAWRERRLVFRQDPLERIAEEFNRFNTRMIRLEGPAVASRVYGGVFDADDTDSLLQVLSKDSDLDIEVDSQEIVIRIRPPAPTPR